MVHPSSKSKTVKENEERSPSRARKSSKKRHVKEDERDSSIYDDDRDDSHDFEELPFNDNERTFSTPEERDERREVSRGEHLPGPRAASSKSSKRKNKNKYTEAKGSKVESQEMNEKSLRSLHNKATKNLKVRECVARKLFCIDLTSG